jgi:hypothetical protein
MAAHKPPKYRVVFQDEGKFIGRGDSQYGTVQTFIKANSSASPYCVPNELICGEIARFLRLPVPPLGIVRSTASGKEPLFASLRFSEDVKPGVDALRCVEKLPSLCAGVLVFDIFVANEDRHDQNLAPDSRSNPKFLYVFDHDVALFGWKAQGGIQRMETLQDRLGVTGSTVTGGNRHCFIDLVSRERDLLDWIEKVRTIPEWFIKGVCEEGIGLGISADEAKAATQFLKYRRNELDSLVRKHKEEFKAVQKWGLL